MKYNISLIISALSLLLFASCEKTIGVNVPEYTPELTVSANLSSNDTVYQAFIGRTIGAFESSNAQTLIQDATVEIYENNNLLYTLVYDPNQITSDVTRYISTTPTLPSLENKTLEIRVSHPDFETATSTISTPRKVALTNAVFKEDAGTSSDIFDPVSMDGIETTFTDPTNEENYYEISAIVVDQSDMNTPYPWYLWFQETNSVRGSILLTDQDFNGKEHKELLLFEKNTFFANPVYKLKFTSISKEKYLFETSLKTQVDSQDNPFAEPSNIYGNIQNGQGIFSLTQMNEYLVYP